MDKLGKIKYSLGALNVRHHFYDTEVIIYVEAEHDEMFWGIIFKKFAPHRKVTLEGKNGINGVKDKAKLIESGELRAIAAMDSDFSKLIKNNKKNDLILFTHGYSIENSLIEPCCIESVFDYFRKIKARRREDHLNWLVGLGGQLRDLLLVDIYNNLKGIEGPFTSIELDRFTKGKKNTTLCPDKIGTYLKGFNMKDIILFLERELNTIPTNPLEVVSFIKGHFIFALARKFFWGDQTFDNETMYNLLLQSLERCISPGHSHATYYFRLVNQVFAELDSRK